MTRDELQAELKKIILGLNVNPKNLQLWVRKSELYELLGQPEESAETLLALAGNLADKSIKSQVYEMAVEVCSRHRLNKLGELCSEKFFDLNPESAKALFFRGMFLYERLQPFKAIYYLKKASELVPENKACLSFLAKAYAGLGMSEKAAPIFEQCVDYDFVYGLTYNRLLGASFSEEMIREGHVEASRRGVEKLKLQPLGRPQKTEKEKPRIGFVSADFYTHSVSFFFQSILVGEVSDSFDIYAYSCGEAKHEDEMTAFLKEHCDVWREAQELSVQQLAEVIQEDALDVLVDLSGYTKGNRLELFSLRPAPAQLHYIGYPHTTGMSGVDYRIVDELTDPVGLTDEFTTEKLLRLNGCFLCYTPFLDAPDVSALPAMAGKGVCFGSFNNFSKVNDLVLESWCEILNRVENSTIYIKSGTLADEQFRDYMKEFFEQRGISRERVGLMAWTADRQEHLSLYERVDIHLDSFPYNGTTTTCEAAWQGVPTVTFKGDSHRARVGYSLMENMGLGDFVAEDREGYIDLAVKKASDLDSLAETRSSLRERMRRSRIMDIEGYSKDLNTLLRSLF